MRDKQSAIFYRDGQAMQVFEAGRHVLTTQNIPILTKLVTSFGFGEDSPSDSASIRATMVTHVGPLAAINCGSRQARKGATVTVDSGAEVRLGGLPPSNTLIRRGGRVVDRARLESV